MKVAFGMRAHSGWAALVVVGEREGDIVVVDRSRVELVEDEWAKQPYHAAEALKPNAARDLVNRGVRAAHRIAAREMHRAMKRERRRKNDVTACAVLVGNPLPDWSVADILAVHLRMHAAEGVLFRDALVSAATVCGLKVVGIPEKLLTNHAERVLATSMGSLTKRMATLGKSIGPPWGRDQKAAALAALIALEGTSK